MVDQSVMTPNAAVPHHEAYDRPAFAAMLMVFALFLLGLQDSLAKLVSASSSLWQFQIVRASFNITLLVIFSRFLWVGSRPWPKNPKAVAIRSLILVAAMVLFFGGVPFLALSEIAAGLYVFPLFVAVLSAIFLGEKVGPRRLGAILVGFTGTVMILKPGSSSFQWVALMPVAAGLCYAATILITRKLCRDENPATLTLGVSIVFMTVGVIGVVLVPLLAEPQLAAGWPYLLTGWRVLDYELIGVIVLCSVLHLVSNISLTKAYQSAESSWLAPFDYSYLIFATFWGVVMWNDVPDLLSFCGMALIATAGCYVAWRERRDKKLQAADLNRALR